VKYSSKCECVHLYRKFYSLLQSTTQLSIPYIALCSLFTVSILKESVQTHCLYKLRVFIPTSGLCNEMLPIQVWFMLMIFSISVTTYFTKREQAIDFYCHIYRVCVCGSVTNNNTWVRIGYRIYSLWKFQLQQITIIMNTMNTIALIASRVPLTELYCADVSLEGLISSAADE
jgi:hypothetical protein